MSFKTADSFTLLSAVFLLKLSFTGSNFVINATAMRKQLEAFCRQNGLVYYPDRIKIMESEDIYLRTKGKYDSIAKSVKSLTRVRNSQNVLTNNMSGGIIKGDEVFRSKSSKDIHNRIVISEKRFDELTIEARKNGAKIIKCQYDDDIFKHLEKSEATASCIGDTLLFRPDATISEVLEETHHFMQNLNGLNDDKPILLRTILNEIEAKEFIINNAKKYNVPRVEIEETIKHLESYKKQLEEYYEGYKNAEGD